MIEIYLGAIIIKNKHLSSQSPAVPPAGAPFIVLSEVESTNNYAMAKLHDGLLAQGTALLAVRQTAGKGQRGRRWMAEPGANITMTTVYQPGAHPPFLYSALAALACCDFIKEFGVENLSLKWPNDVYIGDRKAAGVLVETILRGGQVRWLAIGTGVNLNQTDFGELSQSAVSVTQITGRSYSLPEAGRALHRLLVHRIRQASGQPAAKLMEEYNGMLYQRGQRVRVRQGTRGFFITIGEVLPTGELLSSYPPRRFRVGEISFHQDAEAGASSP